jgi:hypothetical protein
MQLRDVKHFDSANMPGFEAATEREPDRRYLWQHEFASGLMDVDFEEELLNLQLDPREAQKVIAQFWHDLAAKLGIAPMREFYWEGFCEVYPWPVLMGAMTELWATLNPNEPADYVRDYIDLLHKWQERFRAMELRCQAARFLPKWELETKQAAAFLDS